MWEVGRIDVRRLWLWLMVRGDMRDAMVENLADSIGADWQGKSIRATDWDEPACEDHTGILAVDLEEERAEATERKRTASHGLPA